VIDLGRQIVAPQRHPEQEAHTGHGPVAGLKARPVLHQMQLEPAHIVRLRRVRGTLEKGGKALASADVPPLRAFAEIAGVHVLDHALAQRAYRLFGHWKPSWLRLKTTTSAKTGRRPVTDAL
jgi:hypothetical protein